MTTTSLVNRILATVLAIALLAGAVLAVIEIVLSAVGRPPWLVPHPRWSEWLQAQTWDSAITYVVLAGLVLVGLILLVLALRPGKPATLSLPSQQQDVRLQASRRSVEKSVSSVASRVTGVSGASASAGRRTIRVDASTTTRAEPQLQGRVTEAVDRRLHDLGLDRMRSRVHVKARSSK